MSDVNANDLRIINSAEDILETYAGAGNNAKTGIEVELAFFDPNSPDLTPMTVPQNKVVKNTTNAECNGDFARNEPTSDMLEIGSNPGGPQDLNDIIKDTNKKIACLTQKAANIGLKRSYFQDLPNVTAAQLLQNIVDTERYQAFFSPPRGDMQDIAAYFSVCKSNQVSVSYRESAHLLANIRRLYALAPVIFMLTDNGSGFDEATAFPGHAGMKHRAALKTRGGCPDYLFTAKTGEDYIQSHIHAVMNNPLFVYYDQNGKLIRLPSGTWESFESLRAKELNTATNYFFSESILWPDIKIAALRNAQDDVTGHRYEARMIGVGIHQHISALLIIAGLAFNEDFAEKTDALLANYGLNFNNPQDTHKNLQNAYSNARNHNGQFLSIPYGTGQMLDFTKAFATLLEEAYLATPLENALTPILHIARTGETDAKINRTLFNTMEKAKTFQKTYDPALFENPQTCASLLFQAQKLENTDQPVFSASQV